MSLFSLDDSNLNATRRSIVVYSLIAFGCWARPFEFELKFFSLADPENPALKIPFVIHNHEVALLCVFALSYLYARLISLLPMYDLMIQEAMTKQLEKKLNVGSNIERTLNDTKHQVKEMFAVYDGQEMDSDILEIHRLMVAARDMGDFINKRTPNLHDALRRFDSDSGYAPTVEVDTPVERQTRAIKKSIESYLEEFGRVWPSEYLNSLQSIKKQDWEMNRFDLAAMRAVNFHSCSSRFVSNVDRLAQSMKQVLDSADIEWRREALIFGRLVPCAAASVGFCFAIASIDERLSSGILICFAIALTLFTFGFAAKHSLPQPLKFWVKK